MITECISAICTLGTVVLAILITTRAISLEDALKAIGKVFLSIMAVYLAVCALAPPLRAGATALAQMLKTIVLWLVVAVSIIALGMLVLKALRSRFTARSNTNSARDRGDV
jgi:cytochrome c biogenesis protein CcdA